MQARAARDVEFGRGPLALAIFAALVATTSAACAADSFPDSRKGGVRPGKPQAATPMSRCASYGEGFVPVVGSDSCVKIGGRLRIDLGGSMAAPVFPSPHDGISPAAHLRVGR